MVARRVAALLLTLLLLAGCATGPGAVVSFYGDSYTRGKGSSDPDLRWSTIISEERGWTERNHGIDGLGFVRRRDEFPDVPGDIIADDPDIVIVALGINDNFIFETRGNEIQPQIDADFDRLARELPDARIVVVEPFWYTKVRPDSVEAIIGWVRSAAEREGFEYIGGASHWLDGHPEWMAPDALHPNDVGYAEIARRMDEELRALGL